jgi:hypothetical protein
LFEKFAERTQASLSSVDKLIEEITAKKFVVAVPFLFRFKRFRAGVK